VNGNTLVLNRPALNADGLKDKEIYTMAAEEQEKIITLVYDTLAKANAGDYTHIVSTDLHDFASRAKALKEQPSA
jgi:predicted HAD superfamily phosphohydrolase